MYEDTVNSNDNYRMIKQIHDGLRFGTFHHCVCFAYAQVVVEDFFMIEIFVLIGAFLSEASWYPESEEVLKLSKDMSDRLPKTVLSYKLMLECCHRYVTLNT